MDLNPVSQFERLTIPVNSLGADDDNVESRTPERERLLPDTPVEGNREVLHEDERAAAR
jgi:hypothetical protein